MTSPTPSVHHALISSTLPKWYLQANTEIRDALHADMVRSQQLRTELGAVLARIIPLDEFARPLLAQALKDAFGSGADVDTTYLYKRIYVLDPFGQKQLAPPEVCLQTLLHAALQNFHAEEVDAPHATGKVQVVQIRHVGQGSAKYDEYPPHPLNIDPARFMRICRQLDLGGKYQAHLNAIVGPASFNTDPLLARAVAPVTALIGAREHTALKVQAHIAYLRKDISQAFYEHIVQLPEQAPPGPRSYSSLKISGFSVRDIMVFSIAGNQECVVYVPGDSGQGLKQFSSVAAFKQALSRNFTPEYCRALMSRCIAERSKAAFFRKVADRIAPARLQLDTSRSSLIPRLVSERQVDADFDLEIELEEIPYDLFSHFYFQKMLFIKDDARVLAVPTGDEDEASRRARLAGYLSLGMSAANLAALFVPLLGEMMMIVMGAQLLNETFLGVAAWRHGDMDEALEHLGSVAQNLAFMAAFGAAVKAGSSLPVPPVTGSIFVGEMVPIKLANGQTRLWSANLAPFAREISLPPDAQLSGEGIISHQGQHYLPLDGKFYLVKLDEALNKWRIEPPRGERFSPILEHNGAGGWRHEGENPLTWDTSTAFKRLGPEAAALPDEYIEAVMCISAVDDAGLLQLHLDNQPPPPVMADAIVRFGVDDDVRRFYRQMRNADDFATADVPLQLHLLTKMPRWPHGRPVQIVDAEGLVLEEYGAAPDPPPSPLKTTEVRPIRLTQAHVADGKLLPNVIEALGEGGSNRLLGRHAPGTPEALVAAMAAEAQGQQASLFDYLYQTRTASRDPLINTIKRQFPALPTAAAHELVVQASVEQRASLIESQRVPAQIAGRAVDYLREMRVSRVLESFFLSSTGNSDDMLKVTLALLEDLPGWPADLRLQVSDGSVDGPLIGSLDPTGTRQARVLVKSGQWFEATDPVSSGQHEEGAAQDDVFIAALRALPDTARQAIGFADSFADASALRQRILQTASNRRGYVASILQQAPLKPGVRWPRRLADGRIGYELSGRGGPAAWPGGSQEPAVSQQELVQMARVMYPEVADLESWVMQRFIAMGNDPRGVWNMLVLEQDRYEPLRLALEGWLHAVRAETSSQALARRAVAQAISQGWRSGRPYSPLRGGGMVLESADLAIMADLPSLPDYYQEIHRITLRNVTASDEQMSQFLRRFHAVIRLEFICGGLSRVPDGLAGLIFVEDLSFEGMGLTIDQAAMQQFMNMPRLRALDLSGNRLDVLTGPVNLQVSRLYMSNMQLNQWPEWTDDLDLKVLDVSNNQIEHLPDYLINNQQGPFFQTTVYGSQNPFDHDELLQCWLNQRHNNVYELEYDYPESIRRVQRLPSDSDSGSDGYSSDDSAMDYHQHRSASASPAPVASVDIWLVEGREPVNARLRVAWASVAQAGDAPNLLLLLHRLSESADFIRIHAELTIEVLRVLEAAAADVSLRAELEITANDRLFGPDQTCQDGVRLIFSDLQVAVYAHHALQAVPEALQTEALFNVMRSLFRLNEVQTIADLEIAAREARGVAVDHAEVRMAYRIGLADQLNLPGQPGGMVWARLAAVDRQTILDAWRLVLQREAGPEFIDYLLADRRWTERLRSQYQADLQRVTAPIRAEQDALLEHPPADRIESLRRHGEIYERLNTAHATRDADALRAASLELQDLVANPPIDHDEFDRQGRALIVRLDATERAFLEHMTNTLRRHSQIPGMPG